MYCLCICITIVQAHDDKEYAETIMQSFYHLKLFLSLLY